MSNFELRLISPDEELFNGPVYMVVIPGEDGDFAAMHLHSPTITYLRPGKIEVIDENSNLVSAFFTGSGFVKLNQNSCIIMTDYIKKLEDIKINNINFEISNIKEELSKENDEKIKEKLQEKMKILEIEKSLANNH